MATENLLINKINHNISFFLNYHFLHAGLGKITLCFENILHSLITLKVKTFPEKYEQNFFDIKLLKIPSIYNLIYYKNKYYSIQQLFHEKYTC